jgi:hypothetical protein
MKPNLDPVTKVIDKFLWVFWAIIIVSLLSGLGQDDSNIRSYAQVVTYDSTLGTSIAVILLWISLAIQLIRQVFYTNEHNLLVKIGLWVLLFATSMFAFRMTYLLIEYGGLPGSIVTLTAFSMLAISIILITIGRMQCAYFDNNEEYIHSNWLLKFKK